MRNIIKILAFILPVLQGHAQYLGGNKDGYSLDTSGYIVMNNQVFYCSGGNNDGYESYGYNAGSFYDQSKYCSGGNNDGYESYGYNAGSFYDQSKYCSGGDKDGYSKANLLQGVFNDQSLYCSAGDGDGYGRNYMGPALFYDQSMYCSGGNRDGYSFIKIPSFTFGNGIWVGSVSSSWDTPANWAHNVVPGENDMVFIPTGCVYYPALTTGLAVNDTVQSLRCKSLEIQAGAEMSSLNSGLSVYGRVIVAGNYTATNNTNLSQNIFSGGSLQILNDGIVRFGNQSSGTGLSDLTVLSGGTLNITGGVLEIDDQLNIFGSFNMTGGYVYAHKYGAGSAITAIFGPFHVAPGASGFVSGGIVRVCGKNNNNFPAIALNDPEFDFTGSSILLITNGISTTRSDVVIKTVNGSELQNLLVSKPGYNVNLSSDMVINGQVVVLEDASLQVLDGYTVHVNGGVAR